MSTQEMEVGGRRIEIRNADKVLFPGEGLTKMDLLGYYLRISEVMIPHLVGRPLTMQRFPDGIGKEGFYQKKAPDYFPEWIRRVPVEVGKNGEKQLQVVCGEAATLAYLASQACITPHVWLSRAEALSHPDRMIFDIDPPGTGFGPVRFAARALRNALQEAKLTSFLMTSGSKGAHVVVPLEETASFDGVREFARLLSEKVAKRHPDRITTAVRKKKREGRVFLDYLRNGYAQTSVAPYSVRALSGAPVATPLGWDELGSKDLHAQRYTLQNLFRRMGQKDDPWGAIQRETQSLEKAWDRLSQMKAPDQ